METRKFGVNDETFPCYKVFRSDTASARLFRLELTNSLEQL